MKFYNLVVRSGRVAVTVGCSREISIDEKCHRNNVSEMSIRVFLVVLLTVSENRRVHQDFVKPSYLKQPGCRTVANAEFKRTSPQSISFFLKAFRFSPIPCLSVSQLLPESEQATTNERSPELMIDRLEHQGFGGIWEKDCSGPRNRNNYNITFQSRLVRSGVGSDCGSAPAAVFLLSL